MPQGTDWIIGPHFLHSSNQAFGLGATSHFQSMLGIARRACLWLSLSSDHSLRHGWRGVFQLALGLLQQRVYGSPMDTVGVGSELLDSQ